MCFYLCTDVRGGKFICLAQFRHKAKLGSALQGHNITLEVIKSCI